MDGTFRAVGKIFKQLFVLMVSFKNNSLCCAFGLLPDKAFMSYYLFIFMVLSAFRKYESEILELSGRKILKLYRIRLDFEVAIHKAFQVFRLEGCYFHFRYITFIGVS